MFSRQPFHNRRCEDFSGRKPFLHSRLHETPCKNSHANSGNSCSINCVRPRRPRKLAKVELSVRRLSANANGRLVKFHDHHNLRPLSRMSSGEIAIGPGIPPDGDFDTPPAESERRANSPWRELSHRPCAKKLIGRLSLAVADRRKNKKEPSPDASVIDRGRGIDGGRSAVARVTSRSPPQRCCHLNCIY